MNNVHLINLEIASKNNSVKNTAVTDFITFFESPKAKNILTKYGFGLPLSKK